MKEERGARSAVKLLEAIGEIDEQYIEEAEEKDLTAAVTESVEAEEIDEDEILDVIEDAIEDEAERKAESRRRSDYRRNFNRWGLVAAAAAVILLAASVYKGVIRHTNLTASIVPMSTETAEETTAADSMAANTLIGNPWSDFDTLEEAEECAGLSIVIPDSVGHYDRLTYRAMSGEMIEIIYSGEKGQEGLRIRKTVLRGGDGESTDISGDYNSYDEEQTLEDVALSDGSGETVSVLAEGKSGYVYKATWTRRESNGTESAFSVTVNDARLTAEDMRNLAAAIR